jgi:hypothetical protein
MPFTLPSALGLAILISEQLVRISSDRQNSSQLKPFEVSYSRDKTFAPLPLRLDDQAKMLIVFKLAADDEMVAELDLHVQSPVDRACRRAVDGSMRYR